LMCKSNFSPIDNQADLLKIASLFFQPVTSYGFITVANINGRIAK
jgi:hypothetical protein